MYVTGITNSTTFPTTPEAYDATANASDNAFVTKLAGDGTALLYSTYLGGDNFDTGHDIGVVGDDAYIAGVTSSVDFPTTTGAFDTSANGSGDVFVAKIDTVPRSR